MQLSFTNVNSVLKTLPIGYYIGRNIPVELTNGTGTYYDIINDKITIDYSMIKQTANNTEVNEDDIRCLLYHEVSHAFLTPRTLKIDDIVNIVEDERIETICKDFYRNVDFKNFVKKINNYNNEEPKNADEAFYQLVRFRKGSITDLKRLGSILIRFNILDVDSSSIHSQRYFNEIHDFYDAFSRSFEKNQNNFFNDFKNNKEKEKSNSSSTNSTSTMKISNNKDDKKLSDNNIKNLINTKFANITEKYQNKELYDKLSMIINNVKKYEKQNCCAIASYSGVFNTRNCLRNDYKYFAQANRIGNLKSQSKFHLNLFIDSSGSFINNEKSMNELLVVLAKIEKANPNFSFTIITCGNSQIVHPKNDQRIRCFGTNNLDKNIYEQFKSVQNKDAHNVNIVLFDGDAYSAFQYDPDQNRFDVFNQNNVIIITENSNKKYIDEKCQNAKVIYENYNYTNLLILNICNVLQLFARS